MACNTHCQELKEAKKSLTDCQARHVEIMRRDKQRHADQLEKKCYDLREEYLDNLEKEKDMNAELQQVRHDLTHRITRLEIGKQNARKSGVVVTEFSDCLSLTSEFHAQAVFTEFNRS